MSTYGLRKTLLGATMLLSMILPSQAATINGWVDPSDGTFTGTAPTGWIATGPSNPTSLFNANFDYFSFTATDSWIGALVKTEALGVTIGGLQILSFDGKVIGQVTANGKSAMLAPMWLTAGSYYVGVMATGGSLTDMDGYSGTLSISQVPLPPSLALFGAAVMSLAVASGAVRRKAQASSRPRLLEDI